MEIRIKPLLDTDPKTMLTMFPCMDLDRYVLHHILEAPAEFAVRLSPSMKFADCQGVVVRLAMEGASFTLSFGESNYTAATLAGQVVRKNPIPMWSSVCGPHAGYGRNIEEAICKMAICRKFDIRVDSQKPPAHQ